MAERQTSETTTRQVDESTKFNLGLRSEHKPLSEADKNEVTGTETYPPASYPNYLPVWEVPQAKYAPLEPFDFVDRSVGADEAFPDLLCPGTKIRNLTATLGAEISGIQLSQLSTQGKDQLALLVNRKKVLVYHEQDFADLPTCIGEADDYCRYFGRLFSHSHSEFFDLHTHSMAWHSDNSFDVQPAGVTFLYALEVPDEGGDTMFVDTERAYERLSPAAQKFFESLKAVHTSRDQAARAVVGGGYVRREPLDAVHPVVRTNPATGKKALFVNPQYTRRVMGLKKEESDHF
ncbi:hypothetical protein HIM_06684 [Hirsutella minnesotensis 3608]|uniref:TauD/TfdA-like domain-containing protein n=1 Tax=Hirsutella minnesotensis 3608 TaxID=1043627 RepID=A0A0F7ZIV4_9HYPO|nr:hypothetical protein HIM_06684 [Hirsutella minnesotensis 3608]